MKGTTHRLLGACSGVALGTSAGWSWPQILAAGWLAALTSGGRTSPDIDQHRLWGLVDRLLPDEWLGNNGPLQHRGLAHWWGLPAAGFVASWSMLPVDRAWLGYALLIGWTSHLAGDYLFGRSGAGRGPGIPFAPWWNHRGIGLAVGGRLERAVAAALPFVLLVQAFVAAQGLPR